jgi:hypothetical protein
MWTEQVLSGGRRDSSPTKKAPEFCASGKENGAKLRSLSWWREFRLRYTKHQPELTNIVPIFWQRQE